MATFFVLFPNPTHIDIDKFLNESKNKEVIENTMKELESKSKSGVNAILHPTEIYFMKQYEARKSGTKGGRRRSKKRSIYRRRRSSKSRKSRNTRRR